MNSYIGKKGYTIVKEDFTQTQLHKIRIDMTVKPHNTMNGFVNPIQYPIYRESTHKMYLPRYYGIDEFGSCPKNVLSKGNSIDVSFCGDLFEYQHTIVNKFITHVGNSGGGLLDVEPGKGKTVMGLNIISQLKRKTLVVVHKTFLLNQWKERIQQFLPNANIGIIQAQIIDVEDKDIVIGMLQTLSTKDLDYSIVKEFGLTIYDECHHLSAEVFSNVMIRIHTNYVLGLSGTMTRKDGLTKVFKYFIGPVVHKEKTDLTTEVLVKSVLFEDQNNDDYNDVKTDYRGNPMYSSMITKLCNNENRTSMITNIIHYELKEKKDQQIMILAHNKTLIQRLYDMISLFEPSIGFYIGGMKEDALKESESKKVIIATYAMASEGLDIKSLTTLCMATPKSDVCQSVGRILRSKHTQPLVIDIIDSHDIFKRQYGKRRTYYHKKQYVIQKYIHLNAYLQNIYDIDKKKGKNDTTEPKPCLVKL
uniref:Helicase ATP-binding domain-containing protein n=1 Tax=viral metagenome TaxID=1070528 RepID=A0A6C0KJA7_9ZZZZ